MQNSKCFLFILCLSFISLLYAGTTKAQTGCCPSPDSLSVTSVTDSSFCVRWKIRDTIGCDSPRAAQLQYRPVGDSIWTKVTVFYSGSAAYATFCDTASACTKYQWRVRNACANPDTTFTNWVSGPRFTTKCDTTPFRKNNINISLRLYPNPATNNILIEGKIINMMKANVSISDMSGTIKYQREILISDNYLKLAVDIAGWNKGIYFITVSDGKTSARYSFFKQ